MWFIAGLFIGAVLGWSLCALMVLGSREDRE